ncbi:MAG: hypothetical protein WAT46_09665, partial [Saprospiraceae bacterium]
LITDFTMEKQSAHNSIYPKGGVSGSKDSFVVNQTLVFQIMFCGKSPALRVAANRSPKLLIHYFTVSGHALRFSTLCKKNINQ